MTLLTSFNMESLKFVGDKFLFESSQLSEIALDKLEEVVGQLNFAVRRCSVCAFLLLFLLFINVLRHVLNAVLFLCLCIEASRRNYNLTEKPARSGRRAYF